jgi:hypothetical protein
MSRIKKTSPLQNLSNFQTFIVDNNPLSQYFKISELGDLFTAGKNGFLIEGSTFLKPSTEIKIEVLDTEGNPLFVQPGEGIPEYYEGLSKLIGVYVYEDTPIGIGKITILGELDKYLDENGFIQPIPEDWEGIYNIKWERDIKINKNIPNETRVRFVRRPEVIIEELNESFYSRNLVNATQNDGLVRGVALTPSEGTTLRGYRGGIRYLIQKQSGVFADGGTYISVTGTNIQNAEIVEYLNNTSVIVATPFTSSDGLVSNFSGKNYSLSYQYNQNPVASSILGSFGRFEINHLQTFVGDVERIKVFKKSRASNVDYEVIQDTRVEPSELLTTIISGSAIDVGHFSQSYENGQSWNAFWATQSNAGNILDSSKIYRAVKLRNNRLSTNLGDDIRLESGSEYALEFYNYYDTSSNDTNDTLKVYLTSTLRSGSGISNYYVTQSLATFTGSNEFRGANKRIFNFVPPITDNWTINFEASNTTANSYWHVGSVSLKASHELGFSPDEFSFIIPVDRDLERETFDFKFEFFDINNNYVPIVVTSAKTFQSGNIGLIDKNITIDVDKQFFNFSSSLYPLPLSQSINIVGTKNRILGNLTLTRQVFDTGGFVISESVYGGAANYPGEFTYYHEDLYSFSASLDVTKFTGSLHNLPTQSGDTIVDRITYTLEETESTQPFIKRFTIGRLVAGASGQDGTDSKGLFVSSNTNQFFYKATNLSLNPVGQTILIQAKRQNLESLVAPIEVNSSSLAPALAIVGTIDGVTTYSLVGSSYPYSLGEVTYAFTGSDNLGVEYSDFVKISPVKVLDGFSVIATNENTSFPALSTGAISGSLNASSGSLLVKVGNEVISYSSLFVTNSYSASISSSTSAGVAANFNGINYSLSSLSVDSGSLVLDVKYKDGGGTIISSSKEITYSKVKKAAPVISFDIVNSNQSTDATSTGIQIGTFVPVTMSISDTYDGVTTRRLATSLNPTSIPNGAVIFGKTVSNEFITASLANGFDSADLVLNGSVLDSEGSSRNISGSISLSKVKKAAPVLEIITTNAAQSVSAKSTGEQIDTFTNSSVIVRQTYNGVTSSLTINSITASSSDISNIVASSGSASSTITLAGRTLGNGVNSTVITLTARVTDSEGTNRILNDTITLSKVKKAQPSITFTITPQAQTVAANSAGTLTGTIVDPVLSAFEGSSTLTYNQGTLTTSQYKITNVTGVTVANTTPSTSTIDVTGISSDDNTGIVSISFVDSEGTSGTSTIKFLISKAKTGATGEQGPSGSNGTNGTNGLRTATGIIYYQLSAGSAPSTPGATSFTFSTGNFSGLTSNWAKGAPTFAAGNSNKYWYSTYTAVESSAGSDVSSTPSFSTPVQAIGFSGLVTFTAANTLEDGTNVINHIPSGSITNHIGGANVTTIHGGKISTGVITSTGYTLGSGETLAIGGYTVNGTIFNLDNGSLRSRNFFISSSGDAFFKGKLAAAGGTFSGELVAASGYFSGSIAATDGYIGSWVLTGPTLYGTANNKKVQLSATVPSVELYSGNSLVVDINANNGLSPKSVSFSGFNLSSIGQSAGFTAYTYNNQIGTEYYRENTGDLTGGSTSFTISAGDANIGRTCTITANVGGATPNRFEVSGDDGQIPATYLEYQKFYYEYGFRLTTPDGDVYSTVSYNGSQVTNTIGTSIITHTMSGGTLSTTVVLKQGFYSLTPVIKGVYGAGVMSQFNPPAYFYMDINTPSLSSIEAAIPVSKTELAAGGFQVVFSNTRYFEVQRANNADFVAVGGGLTATGNITAFSSDRRLKNNIELLSNPLEKLNKLSGFTYNWNETANKLAGYSTDEKVVGMFAQDVQEVLPEAVKIAPFDNDGNGNSKSGENYLTIQYEKVVPLLVEAIKELKKEIEELKNK